LDQQKQAALLVVCDRLPKDRGRLIAFNWST
jgi:hypothetical protein